MQTIGVRLRADRRDQLAVHRLVGLAEQPPPLRVADDHVLGAGLLDHRRADLAGERAFALPVEILRRRRRCCEFRAASATACSAVNGGAMTISTSVDVLHQAAEFLGERRPPRATVLNIFQLAAMNGMRMTEPQRLHEL